MTAVLLNLRPGHPEFANPAVRAALLAAIDRPQIVANAFALSAGMATSVIPPSSFLFDRTADPPATYDPASAQMALLKAGWTSRADGWHLPNAKSPLEIELLSPDRESNPAAFRTAEIVTGDWRAIGLTVSHVPLPPGEFTTGRLRTGKFRQPKNGKSATDSRRWHSWDCRFAGINRDQNWTFNPNWMVLG